MIIAEKIKEKTSQIKDFSQKETAAKKSAEQKKIDLSYKEAINGVNTLISEVVNASNESNFTISTSIREQISELLVCCSAFSDKDRVEAVDINSISSKEKEIRSALQYEWSNYYVGETSSVEEVLNVIKDIANIDVNSLLIKMRAAKDWNKDSSPVIGMMNAIKEANSQIDKIAKKYDLRPGMGLAAIQLGIPKRFFVVVHEQEIKETFKNYIIINPKIVSNSEEKIYVEEGEGCLSVNRECDGIVPRYARVTIEGFDIDGNPVKYRGREELAIAFQHELDHLNGILFTDYIDPKNPYKDANLYRSI